MSRKVKLLALLLVVFLFAVSSEALAAPRRYRRPPRPHHHREVELITPSEAERIVMRQLGTHHVNFHGTPELKNKVSDYPDHSGYRPVYEMRCSAEGSTYNVDVDAVTGQVLKLAYARHRPAPPRRHRY